MTSAGLAAAAPSRWPSWGSGPGPVRPGARPRPGRRPGGHLRPSGHGGAVPGADGLGRDREGDRLHDPLAQVRRRRRRHPRHGLRRRPDRGGGIEPDRRRRLAGARHPAVLDPRRDRRCRAARGAHRQRRQRRRRPARQADRGAVRVDGALPADRRPGGGRADPGGRHDPQHAPPRDRRRLGARRHRRDLHLGSGAGPGEDLRHRGDLGGRHRPPGQGDLRRPRGRPGLGGPEPGLPGDARQADRRPGRRLRGQAVGRGRTGGDGGGADHRLDPGGGAGEPGSLPVPGAGRAGLSGLARRRRRQGLDRDRPRS